MRFALSSLTTLALAVMFMPRGGNADIIAFDGSTCNGAAGDNVPCDGSCHQFTGRESFKVLSRLISTRGNIMTNQDHFFTR